MNNSTATTIVGWQTRTLKRHQKALIWCRDYGLKPILHNIFIGKLYAKETRALTTKLKRTFDRKTDKVFFVKICQSCYADAGLDATIKEKIETISGFEIIQIPLPAEWQQIGKKPKKPIQ